MNFGGINGLRYSIMGQVKLEEDSLLVIYVTAFKCMIPLSDLLRQTISLQVLKAIFYKFYLVNP